MKKILFVLMACVLCLGLMGGAFAYLSDVESSTGNTFTAGTIDLAMNGQNPYPTTTPLGTFPDVKPSHNLAPITITLQNVGQNEGILTFGFSYIENDKAEDTSTAFEFSAANNVAYEMTADEFASLVYIKTMTEDGVPILTKLVGLYDTNADGLVSLYELKSVTLQWSGAVPPYSTYIQPTESTVLVVELHLGDSLTGGVAGGDIITGVADNDPQADGIDMSFTATLTQVP